MTFQRAWQAVFSVLSLGAFFAVEYMRSVSVPSSALVICSWVAIVAPVLLAILWVVKKQYIRTIFLAALVAATRVSLEDTLSDFSKVAGWFLIGAIVLVLIVAVAVRWWRRGKSKEPDVVLHASSQKPAAPSSPSGVVQESVSSPTAALNATTLRSAGQSEAPVTAANDPQEDEAPSCNSCGAEITDDGARFCRKCGTPFA
jgi:lysylphosphatidylglycerol synthetase-like protein (DUF2156 family)